MFALIVPEDGLNIISPDVVDIVLPSIVKLSSVIAPVSASVVPLNVKLELVVRAPLVAAYTTLLPPVKSVT